MRRFLCTMITAVLVLGLTVTPAMGGLMVESTAVMAMHGDMPMPPSMPPDPSMPPTMPPDPSMPPTMPPSMPPTMPPTDPSMPPTMPPMDPMDPSMPPTMPPSMPPTMPPSMPPTMPPMPPSMPPSMPPMPPSMKPEVDRASGSNRITTAIQISNSQFMDGTVESAVIVNGFSLPDALTAPALAGAVDGPVLFTHADHVSDAVMDELDRLGVERIYLIGGTGVLSTTVQRELANAGFSTKRISGANRYATAAAVAGKVAAIRGGLTRAFVVNASFTSAALSAAPYAYSQGMPILFTSSTGLPAETTRAIRNLGVDNVTVIGGTSSVSSATYAALTRATTGRLDNRISGSSRFENARLLAEYAVAQGWADPMHVGLVNGVTGFAEGLAGASIIGSRNGVVLLVTGAELTRPSQIFLEMHGMAGDVEGVHLYGGTGLISDSVKTQVVNLGLGHDTVEDPADPAH